MIISKLSLLVLACAALLAGEASAKGCLAGAAVGGVAGHVAGKHAVIGAGIGCVVGRHQANKKDRAAAASQAAVTPATGAPVPSK